METYVLEKYKAIQNEDGNWVIFDVPIFAEESRNGIDFDENWLNKAVQLAQERWDESRYMPPFHEEHNSLKPNESKIVRKNLGLFLPKSVQRGEIEGEEKAVVIADILVSPDVFEQIKAGKYPYLSIETGNPMKPEIASLAALPSRAPEVKQSPLMVAPVHFSEEYQRYQFSENQCMNEQFSPKFPSMQDVRKGAYSKPGATDIEKYDLAPYATGDIYKTSADAFLKQDQKQALKRTNLINEKRKDDPNWQPDGFREGYQKARKEKFSGDSQQFGVGDLAKKIALNWGSVKRKLLSSPKYAGLINKLNENMTHDNSSGTALLDADNVASWLRSIPWDQVLQMTNFLFSEDNGMNGKEQFGLMDDLKALGSAYKQGGLAGLKNKLGSQETDEEFQKRSRESRGFAEGDGMDEKKEQFGLMDSIKGIASGGKKVLKLSKIMTSPPASNYSPEMKAVIREAVVGDFDKGMQMLKSLPPEDRQTLTAFFRTNSNVLKEDFADENEPNPEQMDGEGASPIDQITSLLPNASDEILAQILQLLQGAGGEIQAAESDPAPVNQFAEIRGGKLVSKPVQMALDLMNDRIKKMESEREKEKAIHFAEQRLSNVSQKKEIMRELKSKPASSVKELAEFAAKYAGKDPQNLDENDLQNDSTPSEVKELLAEYAPSEKALVCQFAEQWQRTSKTVPLKKFVRINLRGTTYSVKQNSQNN